MICPSCNADAGSSSKFCPSCGTTIARASGSDDYVGAILADKYRVEQLIGEGGMGKVYRARQLALDKPVVLKVLRQSLLSDERTVQRFQREARAASRLNHPNSINVLDFGLNKEDGAMFIAMEFISGKDLHYVLSHEWPLPEVRIIRLISQVLSALSDAHGAGVIHRDLKPENIMVEQRRNEPDFVKVLDFGIAKIQDSTGEDGPTLTRAGFVCGTPEYMSPEQARGTQLDARSDLYAVGVILYQLTSGLLPFESDSAVGFATKHLTEEPLPPSRRRSGIKISAAMEALILRSLSKDPAGRPQTAEIFRQELMAVEHAPITSGHTSGGKRPTPMARHSTPADQAATMLDPAPAFDPTVLRPMPLKQRVGGKKQKGPDVFWFKVATGVLSAAAVAIGIVYAVQSRSQPTPSEAPVTQTASGPVTQPSASATPALAPYDIQTPPANRNSSEARRLTREGDAAYLAGKLDLAVARYREAFLLDPSPALSLKLGELHYQRNETQDARGWWTRHLRDQVDSKARRYIQQVFTDLGTQPAM